MVSVESKQIGMVDAHLGTETSPYCGQYSAQHLSVGNSYGPIVYGKIFC